MIRKGQREDCMTGIAKEITFVANLFPKAARAGARRIGAAASG